MFNRVPAQKLQWLALLLLLVYPIAILLARVGVMHFRNSFLLFIVAALIGFVVLVIALLKLTKEQTNVKPLALTVVFSLAPLLVLGNNIIKSKAYPFIHDISTDLVDPPEFVIAAKLREPGDHSVVYEGAEVAQLQKQGYPDIQTIILSSTPDQTLSKVLAVVEQNGWVLLGEKTDSLPYYVEAMDTSLLFGFKDDVVIRIKAAANGSLVDIRSMSRQGRSDLGVNAERIRTLRDQLAQ